MRCSVKDVPVSAKMPLEADEAAAAEGLLFLSKNLSSSETSIDNDGDRLGPVPAISALASGDQTMSAPDTQQPRELRQCKICGKMCDLLTQYHIHRQANSKRPPTRYRHCKTCHNALARYKRLVVTREKAIALIQAEAAEGHIDIKFEEVQDDRPEESRESQPSECDPDSPEIELRDPLSDDGSSFTVGHSKPLELAWPQALKRKRSLSAHHRLLSLHQSSGASTPSASHTSSAHALGPATVPKRQRLIGSDWSHVAAGGCQAFPSFNDASGNVTTDGGSKPNQEKRTVPGSSGDLDASSATYLRNAVTCTAQEPQQTSDGPKPGHCRTCSKCGQTKPFPAEYHSSGRAANGMRLYRQDCKVCHRIIDQQKRKQKRLGAKGAPSERPSNASFEQLPHDALHPHDAIAPAPPQTAAAHGAAALTTVASSDSSCLHSLGRPSGPKKGEGCAAQQARAVWLLEARAHATAEHVDRGTAAMKGIVSRRGSHESNTLEVALRGL